MACGVEPGRIDRRPTGEVSQECHDVSDVVYPLISRIAAAGSGIPCQELPTQAAGPLGEYRQEALSICDTVESVISAHTFGVAPASVKGQNHRSRFLTASTGWDVDEIEPLLATMLHLELIVARRREGLATTSRLIARGIRRSRNRERETRECE